MLGLPAIVVMDKLMDIWLVEVPPYAVVFTQWIIVRQILSTFSASFYIPMMAANKMKVNSIASVFSGIGVFVILYILFKIGLGPMWIQYTGLISVLLFSFVIKPYVLYKDINYTIKEMLMCFWSCTKVALLSCIIVIPVTLYLGNGLIESIIKAIMALLAVVMSSYIMMEKEMKEKCLIIIKRKMCQLLNNSGE